MARNRLSIDLGEQHEAWINFCKKYKQRPSTMAREVLLDVMICEKLNNPKIIADLKKIIPKTLSDFSIRSWVVNDLPD